MDGPGEFGLDRAQLRLRDELADDGVTLPGDPATVALLLQELDHARRPPPHEREQASYGAIIAMPNGDLSARPDLVELRDMTVPADLARRFSDGRATFLVRSIGAPARLAFFERSIGVEADLVEVQRSTGSLIVQRTFAGVPRVFTDAGVIEWNGRNWVVRKNASELLETVDALVADARRDVLQGILDLCVHWLSPGRVGATLLHDFDPRHDDAPSLDLEAAIDAPHLSVVERHHYPALFAALRQTDLATIVAPDGAIDRLGIGLRSSIESEQAVPQIGGMRHRSAARYTWDHHHTIAFVVSEDGPVTVFRLGKPVRICDASTRDSE